MAANVPTLSGVRADRRPEFFDLLGSFYEEHYWVSLAAGLTRLKLNCAQDLMKEDRCALLSQLTRLQRLELCGGQTSVDPEHEPAVFNLDLPLLERLKLSGFGLASIKLNCPELGELHLDSVAVRSFTGMPSRVRRVHLSLLEQSLSVEEVLPGNSRRLLESLYLCEDHRVADTATIQEVCLNGRLRCLTIISEHGTVEAFSANASWQALPQALQHLSLSLHLDNGIPAILEQFRSLETLSLRHSNVESSFMHLDRPLDPFLDMPRLDTLRLESDWDIYGVEDSVAWTPAGLKFLGMAEKRIMQMRLTSPGRVFTLRY